MEKTTLFEALYYLKDQGYDYLITIPIMAHDFTLSYLSDFIKGKGDVRCGNSVRLLKL